MASRQPLLTHALRPRLPMVAAIARSNPALAALAGIALMLLASMTYGQDYAWDLLNYHYLGPRLLLLGELDRHIAPSGLQSWFNPIGYVPAYLAIETLPPRVASMLFAVVAGLNAPLIYLIAERVAGDRPKPERTRVAFACTAIGMTGAILLVEAGTTLLDNVLSIAALGGILCVIDALAAADQARRSRLLMVAGLLFGAICGLKLTFIVLAAGMAGTLLLMAAMRRLPVLPLVLFAAGGALGFLLTGGWWAWRLWAEFGNPVFPLFNNLFRSSWAGLQPLLDTNFLPQHPADILKFPWHWMVGDQTPGAEISMRDPRYASALAAAAAALAGALAQRKAPAARNGAALPIVLFFLITYLVWLFLFAILRYALVLEMLSGVVLLAGLRTIPRLTGQRLAAAMFVAAFAIILATRPAHWGRVEFTEDWFGVKGAAAVHEPGTVYVMADEAPLGFMIREFPRDARFVHIGGNFPLEPASGLGTRAAAMIADARNLRSLNAAPNNAGGIKALHRFGLAAVPGTCRMILTKAAHVESCRLRLQR